mgnify:FL=1
MSQQIDKKKTIQVRIDVFWHRFLKVLGAQSGRSIRDLIEEVLGDYYTLEDFSEVERRKIK